ncbi:mycothiol synthase [Nocardioides sp. LHG3406-4]|uniref:mycothiol synthase n=1 Tax=Nocardioides sp. LHG3406-4 TaxID=2804575 RepID=UPI003CF8860C
MPDVDLDRIRDVSAAATAADGAEPLDEAMWLALRHDAPGVVVHEAEGGFALLHDGELAVAVAPDRRGTGVGGRLVAETLSGLEGPVRAWSHGGHPAAAALAARHGFARVRDLWVMRRPTDLPLPTRRDLPGVTIRTYRDEDAGDIVRVNAAAFAHHPEQGSMDAANLATRMAEPWFDAAGLLVATDGDQVLGFHWTKRHSPTLGEVYVVGIDPSAQGRGLGKALTLAGLEHLAAAGVESVLLYVESDNAPALAVYSGLGFTHADSDTHVMYARR